jgi:hypothetical protein
VTVSGGWRWVRVWGVQVSAGKYGLSVVESKGVHNAGGKVMGKGGEVT